MCSYTGQNSESKRAARRRRGNAARWLHSVIFRIRGEERGENMAAAVMSIDKQKARADGSAELVGQLDTSMQKAVYIATKCSWRRRKTPERKENRRNDTKRVGSLKTRSISTVS